MNIPVVNPSSVLSVSTLNRLAREQLESALPLLWVAGEISNFTQAASGHCYFTLKDANAQVRCAMWRGKAALLGWRLANGQQVEARALVTLYEARGEFQLNVESIRRAGQGDLFQRFLQLKAALESEGLFAPERKRTLPAFPRRIGIVTSPQAAALRDVVSTLTRRSPHIALTLYPTPVQGEGAAERIAAALSIASDDGNDLLLLCRGGGSIEDLWAFNEEIVARAIVASPVPVISGVGHETDFTIADFAADLRAPTPTAAAEMAAPDRTRLLAKIDDTAARLQRQSERSLQQRAQQLDWLAARLIHPARRLQQRREEIERLQHRLTAALAKQQAARDHRLQIAGQRLLAARPALPHGQIAALALRLEHSLRNRQQRLAARLGQAANSLRQLDPHAVLGRGYALVRDDGGRIVRNATQLSAGGSIKLAFAQGQARATVDEIIAGN